MKPKKTGPKAKQTKETTQRLRAQDYERKINAMVDDLVEGLRNEERTDEDHREAYKAFINQLHQELLRQSPGIYEEADPEEVIAAIPDLTAQALRDYTEAGGDEVTVTGGDEEVDVRKEIAALETQLDRQFDQERDDVAEVFKLQREEYEAAAEKARILARLAVKLPRSLFIPLMKATDTKSIQLSIPKRLMDPGTQGTTGDKLAILASITPDPGHPALARGEGKQGNRTLAALIRLKLSQHLFPKTETMTKIAEQVYAVPRTNLSRAASG